MKPRYKPDFHNRPRHISQDSSIYFFTIRTVNGNWYLQNEDQKKIVLNILKEKARLFNLDLLAYVILNNHLHFMVKVSSSGLIP